MYKDNAQRQKQIINKYNIIIYMSTCVKIKPRDEVTLEGVPESQ